MATIKDVARKAGVGLATASRVLSGKGPVAVATAARVRQAVADLDFRPSHAARSLGNGTSQLIGVYIPILRGAYYSPILNTIDAVVRGQGLHLVVAFGQTQDTQRAEAVEAMNFLLDRDCDGLVVFGHAVQAEDIVALKQAQDRVVVLNRQLEALPEQCFGPDHVQGGILAARALLVHRHRNIAVVSGPAHALDNAARLSGFMGELARQGRDVSDVLVLPGDFSNLAGWEAGERLLSSGRQIDAVFCANDEMAIGLLACFQERGISVPSDISVLGYDDSPNAEFAAPRLTSVHVPMHDVTLAGVNWLLNRCYGLDLPVRRDFEVSLTWRTSVAAPPIRGGRR
ncbi:LacI family DNA-binding transcriptional regulator [Roseateles sp. NT4]|uniref:LacI family DNA-binding transcriptional regulator n=1 Tax=Roseateles sp. NT4 TaxID=3453715 RepID=UPI003EEBB2FB